MTYCDYEFYQTEYLGNVITEADFPRLAERASEKLDLLTFDRLSVSDGNIAADTELDEKIQKRIKKAVCKLAELLGDIEAATDASREHGGMGVSSVSSGSESISYNNNSLVGAVMTDTKAQNRLFNDIAAEYLAGTNLMYAGI